MERHLDVELQQVKNELLRMASLAETAIGLAVKALVSRDAELARQVVASDDAFNMLEIEVVVLAGKRVSNTYWRKGKDGKK